MALYTIWGKSPLVCNVFFLYFIILLFFPCNLIESKSILLCVFPSESGYEFDKASLMKYNHMSFGGPPVTTETTEEANELLRNDEKESEIGKSHEKFRAYLAYDLYVFILHKHCQYIRVVPFICSRAGQIFVLFKYVTLFSFVWPLLFLNKQLSKLLFRHYSYSLSFVYNININILNALTETLQSFWQS